MSITLSMQLPDGGLPSVGDVFPVDGEPYIVLSVSVQRYPEPFTVGVGDGELMLVTRRVTLSLEAPVPV